MCEVRGKYVRKSGTKLDSVYRIGLPESQGWANRVFVVIVIWHQKDLIYF